MSKLQDAVLADATRLAEHLGGDDIGVWFVAVDGTFNFINIECDDRNAGIERILNKGAEPIGFLRLRRYDDPRTAGPTLIPGLTMVELQDDEVAGELRHHFVDVILEKVGTVLMRAPGSLNDKLKAAGLQRPDHRSRQYASDDDSNRVLMFVEDRLTEARNLHASAAC